MSSVQLSVSVASQSSLCLCPTGPYDELPVHIKVLEKIWKPDTFFYNGRGSHVHAITSPNKLLRIRKNGTVLYSMRFVRHNIS